MRGGHLAAAQRSRALVPLVSRDCGVLLTSGSGAGVAGALIAIGVRCVVAAGWAVDDDAATVFAEEFYRSLL
mgnify:CR=1 FL=1